MQITKINDIEAEVNDNGTIYRVSLDRLIYDRDYLLSQGQIVDSYDEMITRCRAVGLKTFAEIDPNGNPLDILKQIQNGTGY